METTLHAVLCHTHLLKSGQKNTVHERVVVLPGCHAPIGLGSTLQGIKVSSAKFFQTDI